MNKKYWAIIILAVVAVAAGIVYYVNQPSLDLGMISVHHNHTSEPQIPITTILSSSTLITLPQKGMGQWQTYSNAKFHYQLQYPPPPNIIRITSTDSGDDGNGPFLQQLGILFSVSPNSSGQDNAQFPFSVTVYDNPKQQTAKQWADRWDAVQQESTVNINGVNGYKIAEFAYDQNDIYIYLIHRALVYQVSYVDPTTLFEYPNVDQQEYSRIVNHILQSFKVE